jgi:hypothetical protein
MIPKRRYKVATTRTDFFPNAKSFLTSILCSVFLNLLQMKNIAHSPSKTLPLFTQLQETCAALNVCGQHTLATWTCITYSYGITKQKVWRSESHTTKNWKIISETKYPLFPKNFKKGETCKFFWSTWRHIARNSSRTSQSAILMGISGLFLLLAN